MAKLVSIGGIRHGQAYVLRGGVNRVGSEEGNDLRIHNPTLSPFHCELTWNASALSVRDLGSTHGTFVEGVPIRLAGLCDGQTLRVGEVEMRLEAEAGETFKVLELEPEPRVRAAATPAAREPASDSAPRVCLDAAGQPVRVSTIRIAKGVRPAVAESAPEPPGKLRFKAHDEEGPTVESLLWSGEAPPPPEPAVAAPRQRPAPEPPRSFFPRSRTHLLIRSGQTGS